MNFAEHKPIYLQIADHIFEKIINGNYQQGERLSSIRELSGQLGVNPNTVMRTYDFLKMQGIIFDKRGVGFFIAEDAVKKVKKIYKDEFYENELPEIIKKIKLLDIDLEELKLKIESKLNDK